MEEKKEQIGGAGTISSNPAISNPREDINSSKTREEATATASQALKEAPGIRNEKAVAGNNFKGIGGVKTKPALVQSKSKKTVDNSRVLLKSANPVWCQPPGGSNNLVIRFSDDSDSDSEECKEPEAIENKSHSTGIHEGQRAAGTSLAKLKKLGQNAGNVHKVVPKKLPMKSKGNSSMSKTFGAAKFRGTGSSSVTQGSQVINFNTYNKSTANKVVGSNKSKAQDLRQQIALRESQINVKGPQNKGMVVASSKKSRKWVRASDDGSRSEPKEPENKRLRVGEPDSTHLSSNSQREVPPEKPKPPSKEPEFAKSSAQNMNEANQTKSHREVPPEKLKPPSKEPELAKSSAQNMNEANQTKSHREVLPEKPKPPSKEPELAKSSVQNMTEADQSQKSLPISIPELIINGQEKHDNMAVDFSSPHIASTSIDGDNIHHHCSQSEENKRLEDSCDLSNPTEKLEKVTPSNLSKNLASQMIQDDLNHPSVVHAHNQPTPPVIKSTSEQNLVNTSSYCALPCGDETLVPSVQNKHQRSPDNASLWDDLGPVNDLQCSNIELQSLIELEEKLDKELEDAQELRSMCEIEERNALKAYRIAQRALIEANARCTELYRQRELCAERFRSFLLDESNLLRSSRGQESSGIGLETCHNVPQNMNLVPASSLQFQHEHHGFNQPAFDPNVYHANLVPLNMSYQLADGSHLGSEQCSEPDSSTSEPMPDYSNNVVNGVRSPSENPVGSVGEEEDISFLNQDSLQPSIEYQQKNLNSEEVQRGTNIQPDKNICIDGSKDYLLLEEAALRSELVARLGGRNLSNDLGTSENVQPAVDLGAEPESGVGSEKTQISNGSVTHPDAEKKIQSDDGGLEGKQRLCSESPVQNEEQCQTEKGASKLLHTIEPEESGSSIGFHFLISKTFSSPFLVRSIYEHMKVLFRDTLTESWAERGQSHTYNFDSQEGTCVNCDELEQSAQSGSKVQDTLWGFSTKGRGCYSCSLVVDVDPSWPICIYELRGKCNNDQCSSQHIRDFSYKNMIQHQSDDSNSECQLTLHQQQSNGEKEPSKYHDVFLSPTYLVCLDVLEADPRSLESVLAQRSVDFWWKCFSICLALSSSFRKDLSGDEIFLGGNGGRIQAQGDCNRQTSFFQSRNGIVNQLKDALGTNTQSLETALLILKQDLSKEEGIVKSLSVLSRALEGDQTSEILWVVYLLICYSDMKLVGKDDMFLYAVKHNEGSYVLWLLYVNSRQTLDDQLGAYDAALSALSHHEFLPDNDRIYTSACILDLFLRMMNCFCMSGNVEKAVQRIYGLLPATTDTDEPHTAMLNDILTCLTTSDKCIFWICCVYLVLYRKLPESVVEQFEYEKELLPLDWPGVNLSSNEKQRPLKLIEAAVSSIDFCFNDESSKDKNEANLRSADIFAFNQIRCMVALDGMKCFWNLWEKYIKLYPSCLELVLMAARMQKNDFHVSFERFEEVVRDWPSNAPGIQCIWNQYAEYAMQNGELNFVEKLMARWYNSVWRVKNPHKETKDAATTSTSNQLDIMFGFLNLSLHKFLQNDLVEARVSIDQALEAAGPGGFKHCIREHAAFLLTNESLLKEDSPISEQLKILRVYLDAVRTFPVVEPLSRKFIKNIEKPRVRQLVSNILCPVSSDSSLVNSVLEAWYGTSLLPPSITRAKDLVDFVEGIMDIVPSNYRFVISLCKQLSRGYQYSRFASSSILFWASSTLMNAMFCAIPIPPEHVWIEAAQILGNILSNEARREGFYKKALSVHPFSIKLWRLYRDQSKSRDGSIVVEAARERGIELD